MVSSVDMELGDMMYELCLRKIWLFTGTYLQKRLREIISLRKYIDHSRVSADLFVI